MNHIYRTLWNDTLAAFVAVPETASSGGRRSGSRRERLAPGAGHGGCSLALTAAALACGALLSSLAQAGPTGAQVSAGAGSIVQTGAPGSTTTTVTQSTPKLAIHWQSFNTAAGETVNFVQSNSQAVALNRVLGSDGTQFLGRLNANGQVFVINPNGVLFGKGAQVNVGGLVASTLSLSDADLMAGRLAFKVSGSSASVVNEGTLNATGGGAAGSGYVALLGGQVSNSGTITAKLGSVALAAGSAVTLDFAGDGLLRVAVDQGALNALASNSGSLVADGGSALMTARAAGELIGTVVNNTGLVQARTLQNKAGVIQLLGGFNGGTVAVAGTLDASAPAGGHGGFVDTSGATVKVADGARVNTLAANGHTGSWLIDPSDYTVAASGGDISGATLSNNLASSHITLQSASGATAGSGNVNVNDTVNWGANTLTLTAANHVNINAVMNASGSAGLALNPVTANGPDTTVGGGTVNVVPGSGKVNLSSSATLSINGAPYTVLNSASQLSSIGSALGGKYALGADLDASSLGGYVPIGSNITAFTGVFDGLGHTISHLTIASARTSDIGMFGVNAGTLRNLGLVGASVSSSYAASLGALAGVNNGTISNAFATGTVSGGEMVGGLVGTNAGPINNAHANVSVSGNLQVGGLVGYSTGLISNAYATGTVSGNQRVGGLVGSSLRTISNAYATGAVSGQGAEIGGLVGYSRGSISSVYATGAVSASGTYIGGLVGNSDSGISNAYATGTVSGTQFVGGLVGRSNREISNAYATGAVSGNANLVGGLVGQGRSQISNAYATGAVSGNDGVGGLIGQGDGVRIFNVYATGAVSGANGVGGISGIAYGSDIRNAYATGAVSGTTRVGGLVGTSGASQVRDAYATGAVSGGTSVGGLVGYNGAGGAINAYWDIQTTGQSSSGGGTGVTTAQLRSLDTFSAAGWNIDSSAGTGSVWRIYDGQTAPLLRSFLTPLDLSGSNLSSVYNGSPQSLGASLPSDTNGAQVLGQVLGQVLAQATSRIDAGSYATALYSTQQGYDIKQGQFTITPKPVSATATAQNKVYDATTAATATPVVGGLFARDGISVSTTSASFGDKHVATGKTVTVNGIALSGTGAGNYLLTNTTATATADISQAAITAVTGITANSKVYDATTAATLNTGSTGFTGIQGSDVLSVATATGAFSDKHAGTGKTVHVSGITLGGADAGNYMLSAPTATTLADIQQAAISAVQGITANRKTYDATTAATLNIGGTAFDGKFASDDLSVATATGAFSDKNAGFGKFVAISGITLGGADAGNYTLMNTTATSFATIDKAAIAAVTGITANNKVYDATTAATLDTGSAAFTGKFGSDVLNVATATGSFGDKNAGTGKTVTVSGITLGGADAANYTVPSTGTTTATITAKGLVVSGYTAANKVYDGTAVASISTTAATLGGKIGNDVANLVSASGAFSDKHAGVNKVVGLTGISLTGADAGNYTLGASPSVTASISKAAISSVSGLVANDKAYDGSTAATLNTAAATYNGKISGDVLGVASASASFSDKNVGNLKPVSITAISLGGADAGNYTLTSTTASSRANITPKLLGVSGYSAEDKVYDGTTEAKIKDKNATLVGVLAGESVKLHDGSGRFVDKNVGDNKAVVVSGFELKGKDAGNYAPPASITVQASITPKSISASGVQVLDKRYDGTTAASFDLSDIDLKGAVRGDAVTLLTLTGNFNTVSVGSNKPVTVTGNTLGGTDARNYVLDKPTQLRGDILVSPACLLDLLRCLQP